MILIKCFKVLEDRCVWHTRRSLEKHENDKAPFNVHDPIECYKYLKSKYGHLKSKEGVPVAFSIYNFGGIKGVSPKESARVNYFPSVDHKGYKLPIGIYGVLDRFPRLYEEILNKKEALQEKEHKEEYDPKEGML